jgi:(1->4)-alpha-D-glucan 1-alpha-D-glucosylmutase
VYQSDSAVVHLRFIESVSGFLHWTIEEENGNERSESSWITDLQVSGTFESELGKFVEYVLPLPGDLPLGYHTLKLRWEDEAAELREASPMLILVPDKCYMSAKLGERDALWGLSCQVYALRSERNWGIGDFSDVKELFSFAADQGASLLGLNPLHSCAMGKRIGQSPYSPSTRRVANAVYLDPDWAFSFLKAVQVKVRYQGEAHSQNLQDLRDTEFVDYQRVFDLKMRVCESLFSWFREEHLGSGTSLEDSFREYVREEGAQLRTFATYSALEEYFFAKDSSTWGWPTWPEEYSVPGTDAVRKFALKYNDRIEFYQFVQWLVHEQLKDLTHQITAGKDVLGLYLDLALGADRSSVDTWEYKSAYALDASMGAPPDALAPQGQNWGLPPFIPAKLKQLCYKPFIEAIRATMRYSGVMRIDHVMSMQRLYWVSESAPDAGGAYVEYPMNDLLGILALESVRHSCLVVGEDLGTVPDEVREAMGRMRLLSYKVMYFIKNAPDSFIDPPDLPRDSLVVSSTHDLPSIQGYFTKGDLDLRRELDLHEDDVLGQIEAEREADRRSLLAQLEQSSLLDTSVTAAILSGESFNGELLRNAVHEYLASAGSMLQALQIEDLLLEAEQANLPGTVDQHPNWLRKLPKTLSAIYKDSALKEHLARVNRARRLCS